MHTALGIVAFVATITLVTAFLRRLPVPAPLLLVIVGVAVSFVPRVPEVELSPELALVGFLPPLLYSAALKTSLVDFRRNARPIALLSVGLVVFTTVTVGLVVWWLLPVPLAIGFALGAVVAPPDAVAATAIARRVGMPRRMVTILQGESLVNDATALVALRTAIVAASGGVAGRQYGTGSVATEIALDFLFTALGGAAVGILVAIVTGKLRSHVHDEITDTAISLITPFISYLAAEQLGWSGVLAVVFTGLILGHKSHLLQSASSRVFERTNWATIEFLLENAVFLLIGLQVRRIVVEAGASDLPTSTIVTACIVVPLTVMVVRPIWVFPATYLPRLIPAVRAKDPIPPWTYPAAISWAGMRGVVTLAAAFVLPPRTEVREVLILVALVVVGATLLLQGATLPRVLRRLGLHGPDPAEDALQAATVQQHASTAGLARLEEIVTEADAEQVVDRARRRSIERAEAMWERLGGGAETPAETYARLRLAMIEAERAELIRLRDDGVVPDDVMRRVIAAIDIEETILDLGQSWSHQDDSADDLTAPDSHRGCEHLGELTDTPRPSTPDGCEECLAEDLHWVHLRLCMTCGHVGCCNSSIGKHAAKHYHGEQHPVIRSFETGEAWRWCFVDERLG
ncbi:MAG: Na+/H+ antiporter [Propionibacteriales bacterium]|nr:Na+/H+ antiporter [Propionibacteriales bacterium]